MAPLRRVDCSGPGLSRRRQGRGFVYLDGDGGRITDPARLDRIRALAIPPAWRQVWICPAPNGHIQATGFDAKGRRQYLYHRVWREHRDRQKFDHMITFARSLPALRLAITRHLAGDGLGPDRVLACAAHLLDVGFFRIGGEDYAEENQTYGLATMLRRHVTVQGDIVTFDYPAKGSQRRVQSVVDPAVSEIVAGLKRRRARGPELLAYKDGTGRWVDVTSGRINDYLRDVSGIDCSAKDFRTWNGTLLAAVALAGAGPGPSLTSRRRQVRSAIVEVSRYLGNTPAVARRSYVDPRVVDAFLAGDTIALPRNRAAGRTTIQRAIEKAVLHLLEAGGKQIRVA